MAPRIDVAGLGAYIREQREAAQVSLRQLAKSAGVSNPYLSQVERGLRKPSAEILGQIAKALRISAETLYIRAGILEERSGDLAVTTALAADITLTERQRVTLLEIYQAFQAENASARARGENAPPAQAMPAPDGGIPGGSSADEDRASGTDRAPEAADRPGVPAAGNRAAGRKRPSASTTSAGPANGSTGTGSATGGTTRRRAARVAATP